MGGPGPGSSAGGGSSDAWYFTREQLAASASRRCGLDADKELSYRQQAANLIQDMGQRLQVSQLCINTAIVYMHRFYAFHSFTHFHRNSMAAAALFLAAKVEEQPRKLEYVIKVAHVCLHRGESAASLDPRSEHYLEQAQDLVFNENVLLQTLGFDVAIDHPHTHVVRTCHLVKAPMDLAQTSYFMASNSLHLTTMCLQYKPTVVACFCIHLASKWSNWAIPQSNEGRHWFSYVDRSVTTELLEKLTAEFLHIFDKCPSRLKRKMMSISSSSGSPHSGMPQAGPSSSQQPASVTFDAKKHQQFISDDMEKSFDREYEREKRRSAAPGGYVAAAPTQQQQQNQQQQQQQTPQKIDFREYREKREREERERRQAMQLQQQQARPQPQQRPEQRPEQRPDQRPEQRSEQRPEQRSDQRPEQRSDQRPEQRSDQRPEQRPEQRPDQRPTDQQAQRTAPPSSQHAHHQRSSSHHKPHGWPHKPQHHGKPPHEQRGHHRPPTQPGQKEPTPAVAQTAVLEPRVEPPPQRTRPPSLFSPENATAPSAAAAAPRRPPPQQQQQRRPQQQQQPVSTPPVKRAVDQAVKEMQPPAAVSPLTSPPPQRPRQRTSSSSASEPELVPVVKKLEETPGYENLMRAAAARRPHRVPSPTRPVNGIETDPTLVSNLLKESLVRPVTITPPVERPVRQPSAARVPPTPVEQRVTPTAPVTAEPVSVPTPAVPAVEAPPSEHRHRSEKKKKKEKHKHKDRDKPREERKKHKKDKEREKREEAQAVAQEGNALRITIPREKLGASPGLKIKIPKERLTAPPPTPPSARVSAPQQSTPVSQPPLMSHSASAPPQHPHQQQWQQQHHGTGIKIKIPKEVVESSRKRAMDASSTSVPPPKMFRHNGVPHKVEGGTGASHAHENGHSNK